MGRLIFYLDYVFYERVLLVSPFFAIFIANPSRHFMYFATIYLHFQLALCQYHNKVYPLSVCHCQCIMYMLRERILSWLMSHCSSAEWKFCSCSRVSGNKSQYQQGDLIWKQTSDTKYPPPQRFEIQSAVETIDKWHDRSIPLN